MNETVAAHLFLDIVEIDAVEIREHLTNLGRIVQDCTSCLSQMIQGSVASQGLRESVNGGHLQHLTIRLMKNANPTVLLLLYLDDDDILWTAVHGRQKPVL